MKRNILRGVAAWICAMGVLLCCSADVFAVSTIHNGISIDNMDMSGKTVYEASDMLQKQYDANSKAVITWIGATGNELKVTPEELGMTWNNQDVVREAADYGISGNIVQRYKVAKDIERTHINLSMDITFDENKIKALLEDNMDMFVCEAVDYQLNVEGGEFIVKAGQPGITVDVDASVKKMIDFFANEWDGKDASVELVSIVDNPIGDEEQLTSITDIIGTYTTEYKSSGASRCTNVANGCRLINGTTLFPGEQFSVLDHIAPFSEENGYKLAGSYLNGLVVDTLGGGICQVSSTLYNAVLLAELQVDERQNHSMIVDYVSPSQDAAITEASHKDFKFTNNKDFPIYIEGYTTDDKTITFNIYGIETRPENREISYRSEVIERTVPDYESIVQDPGKPIGYTSLTPSHAGIKARLIKEVRVNGELESSEEVNKSTYKLVPRTLVVGVGTNNGDIYNQMQAVIATGSIDATRAAAKELAAQDAAAAQAAAALQNSPPAGDP